jgi:hypothetical protein
MVMDRNKYQVSGLDYKGRFCQAVVRADSEKEAGRLFFFMFGGYAKEVRELKGDEIGVNNVEWE